MIFPELPRKHYQWTRSKTDIIELQADSIEEDTVTTKAPLRDSSSVDVDEWFRQHGLATGPAAVSSRNYKEDPIDWFARDAIEFYALCTVMTVWIVYWYGVHRGVW